MKFQIHDRNIIGLILKKNRYAKWKRLKRSRIENEKNILFFTDIIFIGYEMLLNNKTVFLY